MSGNQDNDDEDEGSADVQSPEEGENAPPQGENAAKTPPGGPGGQPQGGAGAPGGAPGGQPQGQPPVQQQQRGYQGGARQPVQTGPSVGDIFSRLDTKNEMKVGIAVFTLIGVGAGLVTILSGVTAGGGFGFGFGVLIAVGSLAVTPALGGLFGLRQADNLEDTPDTLTYATAAVTGAAGTVLLGIIVVIAAAIASPVGGGGGGGAGPLFLALIFAAIGSGVAGAGASWAAGSLPSDGRGPVRPPQTGGAPPQGQGPQQGAGAPPQGRQNAPSGQPQGGAGTPPQGPPQGGASEETHADHPGQGGPDNR